MKKASDVQGNRNTISPNPRSKDGETIKTEQRTRSNHKRIWFHNADHKGKPPITTLLQKSSKLYGKMTYQKTLEQMDDEEMHTAVSTIFHASNNFRRSREQNSALLLSWLDTIHVNPKTHRFLFVRDERNDVWLLNRRQKDCECCTKTDTQNIKIPTALETPSIKFKKGKTAKQVQVITVQPLPSTLDRSSPNPGRQKERKKESNCCRDCCSECANICSNILSG
ncbi:unnamed protein product [Bursaphelenchus xylophilus]|uniref:(pine wood nematode) hypothetical protein n=1 Tax=Bursaphelenchus xylophilus TaxID=6326 RepID=A0A7I8WJ01_BURXY|nr:unnamed protein product [Bursaphelenchus xylophilus]CAG9108661.1 unnamed protein product [Bursaphelenchus xylophilus]